MIFALGVEVSLFSFRFPWLHLHICCYFFGVNWVLWGAKGAVPTRQGIWFKFWLTKQISPHRKLNFHIIISTDFRQNIRAGHKKLTSPFFNGSQTSVVVVAFEREHAMHFNKIAIVWTYIDDLWGSIESSRQFARHHYPLY